VRTADLERLSGSCWPSSGARGSWLPPPKHLQIRVVGGYVPGFIESGFSICDDLNAALSPVDKRLENFPRILDFGCGCGRTTRALKTLYPAAEVHGTDIDPEAIGWLQKNYAAFGEFRVAPHRPPTSYSNGFFDFIVGVSVFTHLPEDMQFLWLEELKRITKPGGYLILTTSGEKNYKGLPDATRRVVEEKGFVYINDNYGQSISLPDFYQNTFHAPSYVEREWARYFEVLEIQPARMQNHQDTVLLRRSP
jgi:SAM-dependent methyltransferase